MVILRGGMSMRWLGLRNRMAALAASALLLAGCGGLYSSPPSERAYQQPAAAQPQAAYPQAQQAFVSCPLSGVMENTGEMGRFAREPRTMQNLMLQARVTDLITECNLAPDRSAGLVDLTIEITANMGPASPEPSADLFYFVALADPSDNIFARDAFATKIDFSNTEGQARQLEELSLTVPLQPNTHLNQYRIYVGFQGQPPER
jgi:hypothetical protein